MNKVRILSNQVKQTSSPGDILCRIAQSSTQTKQKSLYRNTNTVYPMSKGFRTVELQGFDLLQNCESMVCVLLVEVFLAVVVDT